MRSSLCLFFFSFFFLLIISGSLAQEASTYENLQEALKKSKADTNRVTLLNQLAAYHKYEKLEEGLAYSQQAARLAKKLDDAAGLAQAYLRAGIIHSLESRHDTSLMLLEKSLQIYKKLADSAGQARALNYYGQNYDFQGDYQKALEYYFQSLRLYEQSADTQGIGDQLNNIGSVHYMRGEYKTAQKYYLQALEYRQELKNPRLTAVTLNNLGSTYKRLQDYPQAIQYYQQSYEIRQRLQDKKGLAAVTNNLGLMYLENGDYQEAENFIQQSLALEKDLNSQRGILETYASLVRLHLDAKQYSEAQYYLDTALRLAQTIEAPNLQMALYAFYAEWGKQTGDYRLAYNYQEKFAQTKDSLFNAEKSKQIADVEARYETEKKEALLTEEKKKNELLEQKNQLQRRYLWATTLAVLLFVGLLGLLWYNYRNKQTANQRLNHKNQIIEEALNEKEVLLREIHHRVKNNLQIISSLLNLQSKHIQDQEAVAAVQEGRNRVKSMALIHQKLYQQDNLASISVAQYMDDLLESLLQSYGARAENIQVKTEIPREMQLDVDLVIPLGLIVNELVSNSLKHAFPDQQAGQLKVALSEETRTLQLEIQDDGVGLPENFDWQKASSFGLKLVQSLARKLKAELEVNGQNGTRVLMRVVQDIA